MAKIAKALLGFLVIFIVLGFFMVIYCALATRSAIRNGAMNQPIWSCITDYDLLKQSGPRAIILADRLLSRQVQFYLSPPGRVDNLHWLESGIVASIGIHLVYSRAERIIMSQQTLENMPLCKRPAMQ